MPKTTDKPLQPSPQGTSNVLTDENSVAIKEDTPVNTTTHTEVRVATNKTNTPDKYHGDRRKLKAFLI